MIEHHIQISMIDKLSHADSLRFSELKPHDLESNLFMYHLKQLISAGYIEQQTDKSYRLTLDGLRYVDRITHTTNKPRSQPKLITMFAIKNDSEEWLLAKRKMQPYIHKAMLPNGKRHFGESPEAHVERELKQQIGIIIPVTFRGICDVRTHKDDALLTHVSASLYAGNYSGETPKSTPKFDYIWQKVDNDEGLLGGTAQILHEVSATNETIHLSLDEQA